MRFQTEISFAEVPLAIDRMVGITGTGPWIKRLDWLKREGEENPFMHQWLNDRFGIELALRRRLSSADSGENSGVVMGPDAYELAAFASSVVSIHEQLSGKGQKRLRGQLLDGLKSDTVGLLSLQLEVSTITHLVRAGYDVEPHDLEVGSGFDFLAVRDGQETEVECKLLSADIGRKVHRRHFAKLARTLSPTLEQLFRTAVKGLLVRITLPDRLTPGLDRHAAIVDSVGKGVLGGGCDSRICGVSLLEFSIEGSPFAAGLDARKNSSNVQAFVARLTGCTNSHVMMMVSPGERAVVAVLECVQPDAVVKGIRRQLRDAAEGQLTGTRPGCLVAELHDMSDAQILSLAKSDSNTWEGANDLQRMTSELLQDESRSHVHSVVYRGRGRLGQTDPNSLMGQGYTYVVKNAWHPLNADSRCNLFGSAMIPSGLAGLE